MQILAEGAPAYLCHENAELHFNVDGMTASN